MTMRYREKSNVSEEGTLYKTILSPIPGSVPGKNFIAYYVASSQFIGMWDMEVPNFHRRRSQGQIFNNPMISFSDSSLLKKGLIQWKFHWAERGYGLEEWTAEYVPPVFPLNRPTSFDAFADLYFDADARDNAVTKAWANMDVSEAQVLASLGELPETIKWVGSIYTRFNKIASMFKKKRLLSMAKKVDLGDLWLEFRYAVRPLFYEMEQMANAANKAMLPLRQTARGHVESLSSDETTVKQYGALSYWSVDTKVITTTKAEYRAGVLYQIATDINHLANVFGLNKPLQAMWELTPFSFIVDWFFTIGDTLASWIPNPNLTPLSSWVTETFIVESISSHMGSSNTFTTSVKGEQEFNVTPAAGQATSCLKRRIPAPDKPYTPSLDINLDSAKILDLVLIGKKLLM
jgi:hypothetical protein